MSINVSTRLLRNCVSESLQAELDFSKYTGVKRKNLISALKGEKKMVDETVSYIRDDFGLPKITGYGWSGIPADSGFWDRLSESIAITKLKGPATYDHWEVNGFNRAMGEVENHLRERPCSAHVQTYYCPVLDTAPIQTWVEPVDPSNGVFTLIAALERGENPPYTVKFGCASEYRTPPKRLRSK
jgi:hypothetical protein